MSKVQKKHFLFSDFGTAKRAMETLWNYQDAINALRTLFTISTSGSVTDLTLSDDEPNVIQFFNKHFPGLFTVHDFEDYIH